MVFSLKNIEDDLKLEEMEEVGSRLDKFKVY